MATDADEDGYDHYDPVSLASIDPGWRALYSDPEGNPAVVALYGWGVFHHTVRDRSTGEVVRDNGTRSRESSETTFRTARLRTSSARGPST